MTVAELIAKLRAAAESIRTRANASIAALPPLEGLEASQEVVGALRAFRWATDELEEVNTMMAGLLPALEAENTALIAASKSEAVEKGEHVVKADADAQVEMAKQAGRDEATEEFRAAEEKRTKAGERREQLTEKLGAKAAAQLTDDILSGDEADASVRRLEGRIETMKASGITEEVAEGAFEQLVAVPLDEASDSVFKARLASYEPLVEALKNSKGDGGSGGFRASTPPIQGGGVEGPSFRGREMKVLV